MEIEYPSVYELMKGSVCHFANCKHEAKCDECEFGKIRTQAATDVNRKMHMRERLENAEKALRKIAEGKVADIGAAVDLAVLTLKQNAVNEEAENWK